VSYKLLLQSTALQNSYTLLTALSNHGGIDRVKVVYKGKHPLKVELSDVNCSLLLAADGSMECLK